MQLGIPWIADFRDPWIGNYNLDFPTRFHERTVRGLEAKVVLSAERVVTVNRFMQTELQGGYPEKRSGDVITIPNGYDPTDFDVEENRIPDDGRFTIVYTGSFYAKWLSPDQFMAALSDVITTDRLPRGELRVLFIGNITKSLANQVRQMGLQDVIDITGYLSHRQSVVHLVSADLLLMISPYGTGGEQIVPAKLYEYLAARKPVLALAPPGATADLVQKARAGTVVDPGDTSAIADALVTAYGKWKEGQLSIDPDMEVVRAFQRRDQTAQLADILNQIA
jgi:glycosyltransferase involved in cell wall biosynthesis